MLQLINKYLQESINTPISDRDDYRWGRFDVLNELKNELEGDTLVFDAFGLSEVEKASIEADIIEGKQILATPAYLKLLSALLPEGLRSEDKDGKLVFSLDIPEYEVYRGSIRANHAGAVAIVEKGLTSLFGRPVHLATSDEVIARIAEHNHYDGYLYAGYGESFYIDWIGYGWVVGAVCGGRAPYACRGTDGYSSSNMNGRRRGLSLFPSFL